MFIKADLWKGSDSHRSHSESVLTYIILFAQSSETTLLQRTIVLAAFFTSFHVVPCFFISLATFLPTIFCLPGFTVHLGVQFRVCLLILVVGFRKVCPINVYFLFSILMLCWSFFLMNSLFEILSCYVILRMYLIYLVMNVFNFMVVVSKYLGQSTAASSSNFVKNNANSGDMFVMCSGSTLGFQQKHARDACFIVT